MLSIRIEIRSLEDRLLIPRLTVLAVAARDDLAPAVERDLHVGAVYLSASASSERMTYVVDCRREPDAQAGEAKDGIGRVALGCHECVIVEA